ncbi:uncharacterized protein LOC131018807 [Salvia miltiorrhiza]|uniref:uncharacterized protein LOC131018807 n=1 Tax=Salvia miltiorrhiza TaxID=226208 RepID=UPI0025ACBE26|nr:uncharacterized protein LOC131018807 [Salvia miltiorrhiza]
MIHHDGIPPPPLLLQHCCAPTSQSLSLSRLTHTHSIGSPSLPFLESRTLAHTHTDQHAAPSSLHPHLRPTPALLRRAATYGHRRATTPLSQAPPLWLHFRRSSARPPSSSLIPLISFPPWLRPAAVVSSPPAAVSLYPKSDGSEPPPVARLTALASPSLALDSGRQQQLTTAAVAALARLGSHNIRQPTIKQSSSVLQVGGGINTSNALTYIDEGASHFIKQVLKMNESTDCRKM